MSLLFCIWADKEENEIPEEENKEENVEYNATDEVMNNLETEENTDDNHDNLPRLEEDPKPEVPVKREDQIIFCKWHTEDTEEIEEFEKADVVEEHARPKFFSFREPETPSQECCDDEDIEGSDKEDAVNGNKHKAEVNEPTTVRDSIRNGIDTDHSDIEGIEVNEHQTFDNDLKVSGGGKVDINEAVTVSNKQQNIGKDSVGSVQRAVVHEHNTVFKESVGSVIGTVESDEKEVVYKEHELETISNPEDEKELEDLEGVASLTITAIQTVPIDRFSETTEAPSARTSGRKSKSVYKKRDLTIETKNNHPKTLNKSDSVNISKAPRKSLKLSTLKVPKIPKPKGRPKKEKVTTKLVKQSTDEQTLNPLRILVQSSISLAPESHKISSKSMFKTVQSRTRRSNSINLDIFSTDSCIDATKNYLSNKQTKDKNRGKELELKESVLFKKIRKEEVAIEEQLVKSEVIQTIKEEPFEVEDTLFRLQAGDPPLEPWASFLDHEPDSDLSDPLVDPLSIAEPTWSNNLFNVSEFPPPPKEKQKKKPVAKVRPLVQEASVEITSPLSDDSRLKRRVSDTSLSTQKPLIAPSAANDSKKSTKRRFTKTQSVKPLPPEPPSEPFPPPVKGRLKRHTFDTSSQKDLTAVLISSVKSIRGSRTLSVPPLVNDSPSEPLDDNLKTRKPQIKDPHIEQIVGNARSKRRTSTTSSASTSSSSAINKEPLMEPLPALDMKKIKKRISTSECNKELSMEPAVDRKRSKRSISTTSTSIKESALEPASDNKRIKKCASTPISASSSLASKCVIKEPFLNKSSSSVTLGSRPKRNVPTTIPSTSIEESPIESTTGFVNKRLKRHSIIAPPVEIATKHQRKANIVRKSTAIIDDQNNLTNSEPLKETTGDPDKNILNNPTQSIGRPRRISAPKSNSLDLMKPGKSSKGTTRKAPACKRIKQPGKVKKSVKEEIVKKELPRRESLRKSTFKEVPEEAFEMVNKTRPVRTIAQPKTFKPLKPIDPSNYTQKSKVKQLSPPYQPVCKAGSFQCPLCYTCWTLNQTYGRHIISKACQVVPPSSQTPWLLGEHNLDEEGVSENQKMFITVVAATTTTESFVEPSRVPPLRLLSRGACPNPPPAPCVKEGLEYYHSLVWPKQATEEIIFSYLTTAAKLNFVSGVRAYEKLCREPLKVALFLEKKIRFSREKVGARHKRTLGWLTKYRLFLGLPLHDLFLVAREETSGYRVLEYPGLKEIKTIGLLCLACPDAACSGCLPPKKSLGKGKDITQSQFKKKKQTKMSTVRPICDSSKSTAEKSNISSSDSSLSDDRKVPPLKIKVPSLTPDS